MGMTMLCLNSEMTHCHFQGNMRFRPKLMLIKRVQFAWEILRSGRGRKHWRITCPKVYPPRGTMSLRVERSHHLLNATACCLRVSSERPQPAIHSFISIELHALSVLPTEPVAIGTSGGSLAFRPRNGLLLDNTRSRRSNGPVPLGLSTC
jgi:hypothetical protein